MWLTFQKYMSSPLVLSCRIWSFYAKRYTSVIKEIRLKILTSRVPPLKVTQGHRNQHGSIRHLWLPIWQPWAYLVPLPR